MHKRARANKMTRRQLFVLLATIVGSGVVILDGSVVNLALPNISHNLHASFADLQWVVDAYLLSLSSLILLGGSLGDVFDRKRVYMFGLIGFGTMSLLCGLAPNITTLILLRIGQGVFGALLVPSALAIISTNFPAEQRGRAIGRWAAWSGISTAIGPLVGGYLIDVASWRWIFFINVPFVALCAVLAQTSIRDNSRNRKRHLDILGAASAVGGLAGVTFGLIEGPAHHWNALPVSALAAGGIISIFFLWLERRRRDPMVPLRLFRSRNFTGANIATLAMYGALGGFFFALVIYLQNTLGYSSIKAGVSSLPITILLMGLSSTMGGLAGKYGPRLFMTAGPLLASGGIFSLYFLHKGDSYLLHIFPGILLFGFGLALTVAPLTTAVMTAVADSDSGIASGINNAVSRVAGLLVVAMLGLLGTAHVYTFAAAFCATLTALAGIVSFVTIRNTPVKRRAS
jgi:EmrB/QacA subfamily drug resistance transporter